jgi:antitoxin (DNA-binding transcriptional repressor) of toxin-antitoxin stability system
MMRSQKVELEVAREMLPQLVEEVIGGQEVVLLRGREPVARIVPYRGGRPRPHFGSAKGLIAIADDFDAQLDDFAEYMP